MDAISNSWADPLDMALQRELQRGERVLWKGRPLRQVSMAGFATWFFAIPWTAFSLFWTAMAYAGVSSMSPEDSGILAYAFPLFGLPFILIGLGMLSTPFIPLILARKTMFAVTNQRLIKLKLGSRLVSKSIDGEDIGSIERSERGDGSGTLKIVSGTSTDSDNGRQTEYFVIGEVADVMNVENQVRYMQERLVQHRRSSAED